MKLNPWLPESRSGLSQCVQPSWCQATEPPRPGCLIHTASLNGTKSSPLIAAATASRPGWPYTRRHAGENCSEPRTICRISSGAPSGADRLEHLHRMAALHRARPADRIRQRLDPPEVAVAPVGAERRPTVAVERGALGHRGAVEDLDHVALDVLQLLGAEHALEHVEPGALVRLEDRRVHPAVLVDEQRPAVAQRGGTRLTGAAVLDHRRLGFAVVADRHFDQWQLPHGPSVCPRPSPLLVGRAALGYSVCAPSRITARRAVMSPRLRHA